MSPVLTPLSIVILTASSMILASAGRFSEYWSIIAVESIAATGLTIPLPDISGAEPVAVHEWINTFYLSFEATYHVSAHIYR